MADQQPSVGRIVHFSEDGDTCLAAVITAVNEDGTVNLGYWGVNGGTRMVQNVERSEDEIHQVEWHWPERV